MPCASGSVVRALPGQCYQYQGIAGPIRLISIPHGLGICCYKKEQKASADCSNVPLKSALAVPQQHVESEDGQGRSKDPAKQANAKRQTEFCYLQAVHSSTPTSSNGSAKGQ